MLTLESGLQRKTEEIADAYLPKGAIVVISVSTGEILASVSRPTYSVTNLPEYIDSTDGEFVNRAFSAFTPGSVFKTVISAAALEADPEYYEKKYTCTGTIDVSGKIFTCHKKSGHGELDMCGAYAHSCNTYYMNLALELGYGKIYDMAKKFELGDKIYLDRLAAQCGNIPRIENPPPALIANTAIGQGELLITPLEAARIFCCIANNGILPELSIVKAFVFSDSRRINAASNSGAKKILSDKSVEMLLDMTRACIEYGTGMSARPDAGGAGGKTSSAESGQYIETVSGDKTEKTQIVHSWFSGYYPSSDVDTSRRPLYAVAVVAEGGVTSNVKSSVIFKEICDYLGMYLYN
jgi:penicillin-binding protein 2